jgi:hypothetical protein
MFDSLRKLGIAAAAIVLALVASLGLFPTAAAATAPPAIKLSQPTFTSFQSNFADPNFNDWKAKFTFHWTVAAPAGVCSQTVSYANYNTIGGTIDPALGEQSISQTVPKTARSFADEIDHYDFGRADGYSIVVRIKDCNGHQATSNVVHAVISAGEDTDSAITYSAGWSVSHCTCFSGGTTHWTSTKNASLSFRTTKPLDPSGVDLALIMAKAPNRGSAAVYIDGVKKATINTYSKTKINRAIVYQIVLPGSATHNVKIVDLATTGHPRIDLDATINGG